jgi:hypothetical protein
MVAGDVGRRRGDGGGIVNQHQPLMVLMFDSNPAPTLNHCARS